jgi:ABC-type Mn2+/Zn2+ transport system permease subunit
MGITGYLDLFRYTLIAAFVAGLVCPLVGVFLLLRRTSFYGIALPQFATAGVVFGYVLLPWWIETVGLGGLDVETALSDSHAAMNWHLAWAALFTFGGLAGLTLLGRKGVGTEIGRVAAAFAIATAATILFGQLSPIGTAFVDNLVSGEVLLISVHELETLAVVLGLVAMLFVLFHRDLLIVSYDRETSLVLGKPVLRFEALLTLMTGLSVAVGTMIVGPTLLFGLLVLPPLAARRWARSMASLYVLSVAIGAAAVAIGVLASFRMNLPLGAAIVAACALGLLPGLLPARAPAR